MLVVVLDVGSGDPLRASFVVFAITGDVPVVAAVVGIAFCAVTALQVFEREVFVAAGCTTVKDDPFQILHWESFFLFHTGILLNTEPVGSTKLSVARNCLRSTMHKQALHCTRLNAALYGDCAGNRGYYGCKEFQNLDKFGPIYFYHFILILKV